MKSDGTQTTYIVDTNVLIDLYRRRYPPTTFPSLWQELEKVVAQGRFILPEDVQKEVEEQNDELSQWLHKRLHIVQPFDEAQASALTAVLKVTPQLVDHSRLKAYHADPMVVALAHVLTERERLTLFPREIAVLTNETHNPSPKKIPYVCKQFGLTCLTLVDLFEREGWSF